jgi:hypothetical protein
MAQEAMATTGSESPGNMRVRTMPTKDKDSSAIDLMSMSRDWKENIASVVLLYMVAKRGISPVF